MTEEEAYAQVGAEVAHKQLRTGLWTKAVAESRGDSKVAESIYLKLRAEQLLKLAEEERKRSQTHPFTWLILICFVVWFVYLAMQL